MKISLKNKKGFVLIIAIVISTILFTIGIGFSTVIFKELVLSFTARESHISFFASDFGTECIRYWDNARLDGRFTSAFTLGENQEIECDDVIQVPDPIDTAPREFFINHNDEETEYCVDGQVEHLDGRSYIVSWGFNICDETFPRRVDRAIRIDYPLGG